MAGELKSRLQSLVSIGVMTTTAGVATPLSVTDLYVKSVIIQALDSNTDFVQIGDATTQSHDIEPRRSLVIYGDPLDNGTGAQINLATIYFDVLVNGEGISVMYLEGA